MIDLISSSRSTRSARARSVTLEKCMRGLKSIKYEILTRNWHREGIFFLNRTQFNWFEVFFFFLNWTRSIMHFLKCSRCAFCVCKHILHCRPTILEQNFLLFFFCFFGINSIRWTWQRFNLNKKSCYSLIGWHRTKHSCPLYTDTGDTFFDNTVKSIWEIDWNELEFLFSIENQ